MRDIKFRVWNGIEMIYDVMVGKFGVFYVNPSNKGIDEKDSASLTPYNTKYPNNIPLMQFTGLLDKNNNAVYEGDICKINDLYTNIIKVEWYNNGFVGAGKENYPISSNGEFPNSRYNLNYYTLEIIGNIYQNPELLNVQ